MYRKISIIVLVFISIVLLWDYNYGEEIEYYNNGNFNYDKSAYLESYIYSVEDISIIKPDTFGNDKKIIVSPMVDGKMIDKLLDIEEYVIVISPRYGDLRSINNIDFDTGKSNFVGFRYNDSLFFEGFEIDHQFLVGDKVDNIAYLYDGVDYIPYVQKYSNIIFISDFNVGETSSKLLERLLNEFIFDIYKPFESIVILDVHDTQLISCMREFDYKSGFTISPFIEKDINVLRNNYGKYTNSDYLVKIDDKLSPKQFENIANFGIQLNDSGIKFIGIVTENLELSEEHDNSIVPLYIEKNNSNIRMYEYGKEINDENIISISSYENYEEWLSNNYISLMLSKDSRIFIFPEENLNELDIVRIVELNESLRIESGDFKDFEITDYETINETFGKSYVHEFVFNFSRFLSMVFLGVILLFLIIVIVLRNRSMDNLFK